MLEELCAAGIRVPRPYTQIGHAIDVMLGCGIIHGDLSPFNILYEGRHPVLIDFPQAIHARRHHDRYPVFCRDVENIQIWFASCVPPPGSGAEADAGRGPRPDDTDLARELWVRATGEPAPLAQAGPDW